MENHNHIAYESFIQNLKDDLENTKTKLEAVVDEIESQ